MLLTLLSHLLYDATTIVIPMDAMHTNYADTTVVMDKDNFTNNRAKVCNRMHNYVFYKKRFNWKQSKLLEARTEEKSCLGNEKKGGGGGRWKSWR